MPIAFVAVVFTFGLLIFVHELGHFIASRKNKVKVEKFAFGFGPELLGKNIGETRYSLCAIPFGGYVKLAGENIDEYTGQDYEFFHKKWYQRISISIAGPIMNYILAFFIFFLVVSFWGVMEISNEPVIGEVLDDMPAKVANLSPNDRILEIDGVEIKTWKQLASTIHNSKGREIKIKYKRNDRIYEMLIKPKYDESVKKAFIGITPSVKKISPSLPKSLYLAAKMTILFPVASVREIFRRILKLERPELAGPIGIAQIIAKSAKAGLNEFLNIVAIISSMVAFFNLLPIPILDGGHVLLSGIEGITRKKPTKKLIKMSNAIGLTILFMLFSLALHDDLIRVLRK